MSRLRQIARSIFIKPRLILSVLTQQTAQLKLFARPFPESCHLGGKFFQAVALRVTERATTKSGKTGAKDHSVIGVFRRRHNLFLEAARSFVDHQEGEALRDLVGG